MAGYFVVNALFAFGYLACGPRAIAGIGDKGAGERFLASFFFSVHTLATIGYGNMVPVSAAANILVTVESLIGLLGFSVIAALAFARFARPVSHIVFSRNAIIAPYRDITAFMFRIVNQKASEIVELDATVLMTRRKKDGAYADREYIPLKLERQRVVFFPAPWTIVHPIDETSPLWGKTHDDLLASGAEFLVRLNGFDDTFSQTVHTRSSYAASEVVWGARFRNVFNPLRPDGSVSVDIRKLHEFERVALPAAVSS
jgi:inward rectifier potassium channel